MVGFGNDDHTTKQSSLGFDEVDGSVDGVVDVIVDVTVGIAGLIVDKADTVAAGVIIETKICLNN